MATRRSSISKVDAADDFYVEPYEPPDSLWQLIKSSANENELDLIKRVIGESLVETSLDLHNEVDTLLEIWRDYRHETMTGISELKETLSKTSAVLPEPPNVRETLKKEITMFVKQMREHFKEEDKFSRQIVANNHNLSVINYVLNTQSEADVSRRSRAPAVDRPQSKLSSRTGAETPMVSGRRSQSRQKVRYRSGSRSSSRHSVSPPPSRFSSMSTSNLNTNNNNNANANTSRANQADHVLSEDLELYVDEEKLNSFQIDDIVDHLRDLLQKECDSLLKDIDFLYECIDRESEYRAKTRSSIREPTLNELKEERKKLENDLLSTTGRNQIKINALPANLPASANNRSIHSPVMANRPSPPSSAASNASRTSAVSATNIMIQTTEGGLNDTALPSKKPIKNGVVETTKRSNSLAAAEKTTLTRQPGPLSQKGVVVVNSGAIKIMSNPQNRAAEQRKQLSRNNSLASIASSVESSASSATNSSSKLGSAQKFRQMVLDSRDT